MITILNSRIGLTLVAMGDTELYTSTVKQVAMLYEYLFLYFFISLFQAYYIVELD